MLKPAATGKVSLQLGGHSRQCPSGICPHPSSVHSQSLVETNLTCQRLRHPVNKSLGLLSTICPSAGHLQALHTATGALEVRMQSDRDHLQDWRLYLDPCPSMHCSWKAAAGSHLDHTLQLDDVACMPQAHGLAPSQALIAWLRLLEAGSGAVTRGCKR